MDSDYILDVLIPYVCGGLSITLCVITLLYILWKCQNESNTYTRYTIFYICVLLSDLIYAISKTMGTPTTGNNVVCITQAVLNQFGSVASVLWVLVISYVLHNAVNNSSFLVSSRQILRYMYVVWFSAFVFTVLPFTTNSYGRAGGQHCWIKGEAEELLQEVMNIFWRYSLFYVQLWVTIMYSLYTYYKMYTYYKRANSQITTLTSNNNTRNIFQQIGFFPFILILCFTAPTIRRVWETLIPMEVPFWLKVIHAVTTALLGTFDSITMFIMLCKCKINDPHNNSDVSNRDTNTGSNHGESPAVDNNNSNEQIELTAGDKTMTSNHTVTSERTDTAMNIEEGDSSEAVQLYSHQENTLSATNENQNVHTSRCNCLTM
eukprot:404663_1